MKHPQSPLAARCFAHPLKGASPVTGETPATAIARMACSAALRLFAFHPLRDISPTPLQMASPVTGETPATAIARMAGSAALRLFGFQSSRVAHSAIGR